jgi:hypothetical protein
VKTNISVPSADFTVVADLLPNQISTTRSTGVARVVFGRVGEGIAQIAGKQQLTFKVGLCPERQKLFSQRWWLGLMLVIGGPLIGVLLGGTLPVIGKTVFPFREQYLVMSGVAVGMAILIVGLIFFAMATLGVLRVIRSDGTYVWLEGATTEYLAALPESPVQW